MNMKQCISKICISLTLIILFKASAICQQPRKYFNPDSLQQSYFDQLKKEFGRNKDYPAEFEKQILIALSFYPELKNSPIHIRIKKRHTGLNTRPTIAGAFEPGKKRHFVITMSDTTEDVLMPLMFKNLPFNAQVGVMGHELAHAADFFQMTTKQIITHVIRNISATYIDRFEFNTDAICIAHGLGYQLYDWSSLVRQKMNKTNWRGSDYVHRDMNKERYMNPETILKRIASNPIYQNTQ